MADPADTEHDDDDIIREAREAYTRALDWWSDNHKEAEDDLNFARLGKQWDKEVKAKRIEDKKPAEEYNCMPTFIRQVVNDSRQNKPAIKVHPQDSEADPRTAEIIGGLIRNIEMTSDADVAYDTAIEHAVGQGFGFWRYNTKYTCDDSFEQDIVCERIINPFTVLGDPSSTAADSSDWNVAFIVTTMTKKEFERDYPNAEKTNWASDFNDAHGWLEGENVTVAEYWTREKVKGQLVILDTGDTLSLEEYQEHEQELTGMRVAMVDQREAETYKVTQRIMSGAEILDTVDWPGKFIPIVPVYGDEVSDETGKRHFRSLIRDAKGEQRTYNYMRNTALYLLALQPRVPFIGPKGAFASDENWENANKDDLAFLEYDGGIPPQRQMPPQGSQAVLQEALNASDGMKKIIGIYDASLGAKSNETSGRAIMARQREGDVSTFHFIDNLSRAIRHGGRILLDLIPKVYTTERMIRVLGDDLKPRAVQIAPNGQPAQEQQDEEGNIIAAVYDLTAGKYDLTVSTGPSFTSRREEVANILTEVMRSVPDSAVFLAGRLARVLDLPDAEELAAEMDMLNPAKQQNQGPSPEQMQELQGQLQQAAQQLQQLQQENQQLKADDEVKRLELGLKGQQANQAAEDRRAELALKTKELDLKEQELRVKMFEAQTDRIQANQPEEEAPAPELRRVA